MTITTPAFRIQAIGNGAATVFSFSPLTIFANSDLSVIKTDANGLDTTLTEGSGNNDYIVTLVDGLPGTGSITYPATGTANILATGETLTLRAVLPLEQRTDLQSNRKYFAEVLETALDRLIVIAKQQQSELEGVIRFPITDFTNAVATLPSATARAGKSLAFDGSGNVIAGELLPGTFVVSTFVETLLDDADAATFRASIGAAAQGVAQSFTGLQTFLTGVEVQTAFTSQVDTQHRAGINLEGDDSASNATNYAGLTKTINSNANGSENGTLDFRTIRSGAEAARFHIGNSLYADGVTGGDKAAGEVNAQEYYRQNQNLDDRYSRAWTYAAEVDLSGATAFNFSLATGIPDYVTEIEVLLNQVRMSVASAVVVRLGTSAGIQDTNYDSSLMLLTPATQVGEGSTNGVRFIRNTDGVSFFFTGHLTLRNVTGDLWIGSGQTHFNTGPGNYFFDTRKDLGAPLTQLDINGSASGVFNFGSARVRYR